uniref:Globin family profile domain-containing protein n=1 Tax=Ditylenchus dipsaci TaxID=166011 RepID=A0A915EG41_9BILA
MGNNDSRSALHRDGSQSYVQNPSPINKEEHKNKLAKHRSLSPKNSLDRSPRRTESFKNKCIPSLGDNASIASSDLKKHRPLSRRAKSFRYPNRSHESSFRVPVCPVTGLSVNQKKMIKLKWADLDRQAINDMGRNIFETTFRKDPKLLKVIGLDRLSADSRQIWKDHIKFRVHFQRFASTLNEVIRTLEEPRLTTDRLLEFGAEYALYLTSDAEIRAAIVPSNYWETLIFGFNNAAKDLQVESSRGSESPSLTNSTERRFLMPSSAATDDFGNGQIPSNYHHKTSSPGDTSPMLSPSIHASNTSRYCHSAPVLDANLGNKLDTGGSNTTASTPTPSPSIMMSKRGFGFGSVCPVEAEAWNLLAVYVVGQLKFGYSMEMLLQEQIKRLSQSTCQVSNEDDDEEEEESSPEEEANLKKVASMKATKTLRSSSTIATPPIYLQCSLTEPVPIV